MWGFEYLFDYFFDVVNPKRVVDVLTGLKYLISFKVL
jgi:hypothetical protein